MVIEGLRRRLDDALASAAAPSLAEGTGAER